MRDKLNNSPIAQVGLVIVLLLAAGYFLLGGMGGGSEEEAAPTEATVTVAGTNASGTATGSTPGEAVEGAVEGALEAAGGEASAVPASVPAPPLPRPVLAAYKGGKTVVLLVVHDGAIVDGLVKEAADELRSMSEVTLFVVPADKISRYAAITLGVDVDRTPALVTMTPRDLSEGVPQAAVIYGFQSPQSVVQAVEDAAYDGPTISYHPE